MKKQMIIIGFMFLLFATPTMGAVTLPFSDDFEAYSVGTQPPSPWTNLAGGPGIVTNVRAYSGSKSVIVSGGPFGSDSSVIDLGTNFTDFLQYEGWVYSAGGEGLIGFHEQFQNMAPSFNAVRFMANGDAYFESADRDTGFRIQIASGLTPGWHHVKGQLNFGNLIGSVWLDGTLVINSLPISPKENVIYGNYGSGPLRHIGIIHSGYTPVYFDDFSVFEWVGSEFSPTKDEFGFENFKGFFGIPYLEQTLKVIGNCAGMTYASLYYYYLGIDPLKLADCSDEPPYGNLQRTYIEFLEAKYNNPTYYSFIDFLVPSELENLVNYELIKQYIRTFKLPYPVRLKGTSVVDFHAVLVYKIVDEEFSKKMYIYDSNRPYCSTPYDIYIELEPTPYGLNMKDYQYLNLKFSSFRPYSVPFDPTDLPLAYVLHSPGHLRVTDPDGFAIDPESNQIASAIYLFEDIDNDGLIEQFVVIGLPKQGRYIIEVLPNPADPLSSTFTLSSFSSGVEKILAQDIPLGEAPGNGYTSFGPTVCEFQILNKVVNPKRNSWHLVGIIRVPEEYLISDIDLNSIKLNGFILPNHVTLQKDRMLVHFDATELLKVVEMAENEEFKLTINGAFESGGGFLGEDFVRVILFKK